MSKSPLKADSKMILGYYPIRAKGQIPRLLCEYLELPYKDLLFTPPTWDNFRSTQSINWIFADLPFLMDRDFVVTERYPICLYLINKANRKDLLGCSLEDEIKVDIFMSQTEACSFLISQLVQAKDLPEEEKKEKIRMSLESLSQNFLAEYEQKMVGPFYLGYISLIDFFLYEIMYLMSKILPEKTENFPKTLQVYQAVS